RVYEADKLAQRDDEAAHDLWWLAWLEEEQGRSQAASKDYALAFAQLEKLPNQSSDACSVGSSLARRYFLDKQYSEAMSVADSMLAWPAAQKNMWIKTSALLWKSKSLTALGRAAEAADTGVVAVKTSKSQSERKLGTMTLLALGDAYAGHGE